MLCQELWARGEDMELLIVDDEASAILAVIKGISWERLKFTGVFTASNITEAKEKLMNHDIRVLLCDIEMPMGSGLELLEWVNEYRPGICSVFMTCHADFSYAQRAIQLGSFDYILKPLDFEALEKVLKSAAQKVDQEEQQKQASNYWEKGRKAVERQFWRELFIGDIAPNEGSISIYLKRNQLDIPIDGKFLPILLSPKRLPENMTPEDRKLIRFSLRNVAEEVFQTSLAKHELEALGEDEILVMLTVKDGVTDTALTDSISQCCEILIEAADQYLHIQVCCYVGYRVSISEISGQIEQLHGMDFNNIVSNKIFLFLNPGETIMDKFQPVAGVLGGHRNYSGNCTRALSEIQQALTAYDRELEPDSIFINAFYMGIYYILSDFSRKNQVFIRDLVDKEQNRRLSHLAMNSMAGLAAWVQHIRSALQAFEKDDIAREAPVDKVKEYIKAHLDKELSVEKIAGQVHLNPDYLNRIFKKVTGVPLSQYTIQQKMERAKWLLRHTNWQIGEVAAAVGYYNYSSFNRSFNKIVGQSPQEWKNAKNK